MFSRRHPFLFFVLSLAGILAGTAVLLTLLVVLGTDGEDLGSGERVGVIEITGMIADARDTLEDIKRFREADGVKAIVLRIDSPGGVVGPSQEIYREIRKTVSTKKVVASMGSIAASGGYYVAAAADGIVANPGTITGSIGVIIGYTNFRELMDRIGLTPVVVKSGRYKDLASPVRELSEEDRKILQEFVDHTHRQFVEAVAQGRGMEPDKVAEVADGRIYTGEQARDLGLVDRLGNFEDAVEWAGRLAGIEGRIETVYAREDSISLWRFLSVAAIRALSRRLDEGRVEAAYLYRPEPTGLP